ncbi:MAG: hypothetical protein ACYC2H_08690 [Thermoplasmatota archaeon]
MPDMTTHPDKPAFRMSRFGLLLATACALLVVAAPANALPALPAVNQSIDTPAGRIDASAGEYGARFCSDLATPALPSLPATPALPVPVPALPSTSAKADVCASAGLDGASAQAGVVTAVGQAGAAVDAQSPISHDEVEALADETTGNAKGLLQGLIDTLFGWM